MVINELIKLGLELVQDREYINPILEARLILSKLLKVDKTYIYTNGEKEVSKEIQLKFIEIMKRRSHGYPIQYLLGEKEFMGLDFYVEEGVLIPRPDTEILVEYLIHYININHKDKEVKVLDIGIGSGAISLSIAKFCPNVFVYGVDIGDIPIKVASINKDRFNLSNVEFVQGDMFEPLKDIDRNIKFNIIVSNPPYIPKDDIEKLQTEVKDFEPRLALDGGIDGLDFYKRISEEAKDYLYKDGLLIYEIGYNQSNMVEEILLKNNFKDIKILKDYQGFDRVIMGNL